MLILLHPSQVADQKLKVEKAGKLRERFYNNKAELEMTLRQCEDQLKAVDVLGVSVPTKLDRYKVRERENRDLR